jgi:ubiquinone/menaquinone biosynthesis C-methylase UbiE
VSAYDAFAPIYDEWAAHMTEDVPFYVELAREADGPVVELAVGSGRVAVPVAQETGRRVIGIDSSPAMLAAAGERAAAAGVELDLREGDMRDLELDEPAALVYSPFRSLLHLRGWVDKRRVFERVAAALRPGGRFAWNAFVFDHEFAARHDGLASRHGDLWEYTEYVAADSRIDATVFVGEPGADPRTVSLWWCTRSEWEGLIETAGLEVEALYGWFDRRPFDDRSPEFVWIARRPR